MTLYRVDIRIAGTAYVKAKSIREAHKLVNEAYRQGGVQLSHEDVSEDRFDSPDFPDLSLSSEATVMGAYGLNTVERVEDWP